MWLTDITQDPQLMMCSTIAATPNFNRRCRVELHTDSVDLTWHCTSHVNHIQINTISIKLKPYVFTLRLTLYARRLGARLRLTSEQDIRFSRRISTCEWDKELHTCAVPWIVSMTVSGPDSTNFKLDSSCPLDILAYIELPSLLWKPNVIFSYTCDTITAYLF